MIDNLVQKIKEHEGFRGDVYKDSLGFNTVGYGTKMPISKMEATTLLRTRLMKKIDELTLKEPSFNTMPDDIREVLCEMSYQMGVNGVLKFRKMWKALKEGNYERAADEMLDSRWAKQTPSRAKELSDVVRNFT